MYEELSVKTEIAILSSPCIRQPALPSSDVESGHQKGMRGGVGMDSTGASGASAAAGPPGKPADSTVQDPMRRPAPTSFMAQARRAPQTAGVSGKPAGVSSIAAYSGIGGCRPHPVRATSLNGVQMSKKKAALFSPTFPVRLYVTQEDDDFLAWKKFDPDDQPNGAEIAEYALVETRRVKKVVTLE